jgi:hypothetical protein
MPDADVDYDSGGSKVTPDFIVRRAMRPDEHPVDYFWELLDQLSDDDYPAGVLRVPEKGLGTWAFSSSNGLAWWPGTPRPAFPVGGVMFVGDNLNAYGQWMKKRTHWGDPNKPTMTYWKRVWPLLKQGGVPTSTAFFTNFYVGLMEGDNPSAPFPGRKDLSFSRWCAAFLIEQIHTMQPSLVVALGVKSQQALDRWNVARRAGVDGKSIQLSHPSARISNAEMASDAARLRKAYAAANLN